MKQQEEFKTNGGKKQLYEATFVQDTQSKRCALSLDILKVQRTPFHGCNHYFKIRQQRKRLGLMLLSQQIIHGFYWVECGQWNLYKHCIPIAHGSIPQSR